MAEFDSSVVRGEVPIDAGAVTVAAVFPDSYELAHFSASRDSATKALPS